MDLGAEQEVLLKNSGEAFPQCSWKNKLGYDIQYAHIDVGEDLIYFKRL